MEQKKSAFQRIDPVVFGVALILFVILLVWALSGALDAPMNALIHFLEYQCGFVYLFFGFLAVALCVILAVSPMGKVVLGKDGEKPKYSFFSWFCMMFACGYGVGLVYWGAAEPLSFFLSPPMGYPAGAPQTADFALGYAYFHWGFTAWALYAIVSIPLAYFVNRKGWVPRFSATLSPVSRRLSSGNCGRGIDGIIIVCLICGLITSVGLAIMQVAGGLEYLFGIPSSTMTYIIIGLLWTALIVLTAVSGVDKGIKYLSNINIPLAFALLIAVLVLCCPDFCINLGTSALGKYFDGFLNMSFWTDAAGESGFPQSWTIFYWAWWISCSPIVGIFVANISRGRTIRQLVFTMLGAAAFATFMWFAVFGGSAIFMEMTGVADLSGVVENMGTNYVIFAMLENLPLSGILSVLFILLIVIFLATSANSAAFICAQMSTKDTENPMEPPKAITGFWSLAVCILGIVLIIVGKGITGLQTTSIVGSALLMAIVVLMVIALLKELRKEKI